MHNHIMEIKDTLKAWMAYKNTDPTNLAARVAGLNQSTIQRVVSGETGDPRRKTLLKIAEALGISIDDMERMPPSGMPESQETRHDAVQQDPHIIKGNSSAPRKIREWSNVDEITGDGFFPFPVLRINLSAGPGEEVIEVDTELQPVEFPLNVVRREGVLPGDCAAMYVTGTSMLPQFNDGDCVLIDYKRKQLLDNKIFALVWKGEHFLKRIIKKADGGIILVSDNKIGNPDREIPAEYVHEVHVIGRAIAKAGGVY